jgi:transcriptional regulator with XRE-family HTH domain
MSPSSVLCNWNNVTLPDRSTTAKVCRYYNLRVPATVVDVDRLFGVLEDRVTSEGVSWRAAAAQIGVSPSLLSRLRNGMRPDLDAYLRIVRWLGLSADDFLIGDRPSDERQEPELGTEISALLRARKDLTDEDKDMLESIFRSSLQHVRRTRDRS